METKKKYFEIYEDRNGHCWSETNYVTIEVTNDVISGVILPHFLETKECPDSCFPHDYGFYLDNSRARELVGNRLTQKDIMKLEEIEECLTENCVFFRQ
ncbi:MAG: hypothetical protein ACTTKI_00300 [Tannerella sp.]|uniref:hypothetical protein n=1 Tax=Tannerella sp. TaxID=2382127 RepID=UPI003FA2F235